MRRYLLIGLVVACESKPKVPEPAPAPAPQVAPQECTDEPFAQLTPVPEASGAAWLGTDKLFVISDSGNGGKYGIIDANNGYTIEEGTLPLGGDFGDDLEGVAVRSGKFHVISSPGWIRSYKRVDRGFELVDPPYALGPIDIDDKGGKRDALGDRPPQGSGMVCAAKNTNCGRNYEGLCLLPDAVAVDARTRCIGFAAAKADGHLYCIQEDRGKLTVHYQHAIRISRPGVLSDCAFSDDGTLYAASNLFDAGNVYRIVGWREPSEAKVETVGAIGIGFPETIAVKGNIIYRMSDTGAAPSMMRKVKCP